MKTKVGIFIFMAMFIHISFTVFAAENNITVEELKLNTQEENVMDSLKLTADDEEGMLRVSPSDLLKIKLKIEGENSGQLMFLANRNLDGGEFLSENDIQFIDNKVIAEDGTVNIQFCPRLNQDKGIYNMRATSKNAVILSRFYKLVGEEIQPVLSVADDTAKKEDIEITVSGYTDDWKNVNALYDVSNGIKTEIPADEYSFEKDSSGINIATLRIKTTGGWASTGEHTLRFVPSDKAYNPITFTVDITAPVSSIRTNFVSSTGTVIPEGLNGTVTVQERAKEQDNVEFTAVAPDGYEITRAEYKTENSENAPVTAEMDKYSFIMPADDVIITVTVTPKTYILNLDLQGGNYEGSTTITGTVETLLQLPPEKPEKNDFSFTNWRTEPSSGGSVVKNEHFDTAGKVLDFFKDLDTKTIYACYMKQGKFNVAYLAPEQGVTDKPSDSAEYIKENTKEIIIPQQEPKRKGYKFLGWKVDGDNTLYKYGSDNDRYTNIASIEDKLEFYAQWDAVETDDYVIIDIDKENSNINVIKRKAENAWLIVAAYDSNDKLVKVTIKDISDVQTDTAGTDINIPNAFNGECTKVKVFMWNSLDNMQPRCDQLPK